MRSGGQQLLDAHGVRGGRRMRIAPSRIAEARHYPGQVDHVLDRKPQSGERAITGRASSSVSTNAPLSAAVIERFSSIEMTLLGLPSFAFNLVRRELGTTEK